MKHDFETDVKNQMYKNKDEISSLIPYLYRGVPYALDLNADPLLRAYIASAITAYQERNNDVLFEDILSSINLSDLSDQKSRSQFEIAWYIIVEGAYTTSQVMINYNKWNFDKEEKSLARHLFTLSMGRLHTSFKAAASFLNSGFFVEVVPVFRLILEQLAWGSYLLEETDETKILKNKVQSDIKYLKTVLNNEKFGQLYGYLSREAHLEPSAIQKYLDINIEEKSIEIIDRSGEKSKEDTTSLALLLEAFDKVVWEGMNRFGFQKVDKQYFEDWHKSHMLLTKSLKCVLNGTVIFNRVD